MTCPHYHAVGQVAKCGLAPGVLIPQINSPHNPCPACHAEWMIVDGIAIPPIEPTPTIIELQTARTAKPASPRQPRREQPTPATVRQHPDHCAHQLRVIDHTGCCGSRRWQCELKGEVRLTDCRRCAEFERDSPESS